MEINNDLLKKILGVLAAAIAFYLGLQHLDVVLSCIGVVFGIFTPFILGLCIAFLLIIAMVRIEKLLFGKIQKNKIAKKVKRPVSLLLSIIFVVLILVVVFSIVLPEIVRTVSSLSAALPAFFKKAELLIGSLTSDAPALEKFIGNADIQWDTLVKGAWQFLQGGVTSILGSTLSVATSVFSGLFNFALGFVFAVYVLLQKENLGRQCKKILYAFLNKNKADKVLYVAQLAHRIFSSFFTGQCIEAVILGAMFFVSMSIFRMPYALMVAVMISFAALIPVFGSFIGFFIGAFLIFVVSPIKAFWFVVLFLALQQIEGNLIYPKVVGSSVGLPAIWVLAAVTIGGSVLGVIGMLITVPLFSVIYTLMRETVNQRLKNKNIPL
ncbi:MAG: AI-2E family transporter [Oscillospiraceae bacterium]